MRSQRGRAIAATSLCGLTGAAAGLLVRPGCERSGHQSRELGRVRLRDGLPPLLRSHLDLDGDGWVPRVDTHTMWSRPLMRRGPLPPLPLRMRSVSRVGESFVNDIEMVWYGHPVLRVIDAFVDGRGITKIGPKAVLGEEIDQGANLFLWSEAFFVPSAFREGSPVAAEQIAAEEIRLTVPFGSGHHEATVRFADGRPSRFSALRFKRIGHPKIWWHVDYSRWIIKEGIAVPRRIEVTWEDERRSWLSFDLDGFAANVEIEPRLRQVSELIRDHDRTIDERTKDDQAT
ncbi:MAG TPA: DUF6544 family protein [Actinomycetota bacterium]|nr:DUF6544 family protein [Actinomycetota bacterium]